MINWNLLQLAAIYSRSATYFIFWWLAELLDQHYIPNWYYKWRSAHICIDQFKSKSNIFEFCILLKILNSYKLVLIRFKISMVLLFKNTQNITYVTKPCSVTKYITLAWTMTPSVLPKVSMSSWLLSEHCGRTMTWSTSTGAESL